MIDFAERRLADFLEQRALARDGAFYEQTRAIASIGLLIACADGELTAAEVEVVTQALPALAAIMGLEVASLDLELVQVIGRQVAQQIQSEGEQGVFDAAKPHLRDEKHATLAVALSIRAGFADGTMGEDELTLLRPIALHLGLTPERVDDLLSTAVRKPADAVSATLH